MKAPHFPLAAIYLFLGLFATVSVQAIPIAGVDFDDGFGGDDITPDDLDPADGVTVSTVWTFAGVGGIAGVDNNSNAGRPAPPVRKFNGPNNSSATPPAVGSAPPTDGVHSFSITIDNDPISLNSVSFDFSNATGSTNQRWIAFRTSLDPNIIFSENGVARPAFPTVVIPLTDPKYSNLSNQTIDFIWYSGGQGSGDSDIDTIIIDASTANLIDTDGDGLDDRWEQQIIDADAADGIVTINDVLPGDDYDADLATNLAEQTNITDPVDPDTDDDGYIDGVETNDGTFDNIATDTGTDPLVADTDGDGLLDGVETNDGTFDDIATDTGSNPLIVDTDADTIPDGYEAANGQDPGTNDSALDPDSDGSDNLQEFTRNTDPQVADTDGDGILDGPETNDGSYDSAADTGTDPLDPDTDDDGLLDGVETNSGIFVDSMDTGSNPLLEDTDSGGFRDGAEVTIHGTDPNNAASEPSGTLNVLFIGGNADGTQAADPLVIRFIEDKYGIGNVTYLQASLSMDGDEDTYDLLVLSSTPSSGDIRDKFEDSLVPIVNWEEAISDNGTGEFGMATAILTKSIVATEMAQTGHPITAGLPDPIVLFDAPGPQTTSTAVLFPGLTSAGNEAVSGESMIMLAEVGDAVDPGAGIPGNIAPARRVMLPWTDQTTASLTPDGWTVFGNALDWAVGRIGGTAPPRITDIVYDASSQPGNLLVSLTFDSELGKTYSLFASTDLDIPVFSRGDIDDSIPGDDGSTTFVIDYNFSGLDVTARRYFFVVSENP